MKKGQKKRTNPGKVLLTLFVIVVVILGGLFVFHKIKLGIDMKYLTEKGYYNPVSIGDYSVNVIKVGNENGKGKIVVLSGMGAGLSVDLRKMTKSLEQDYQFVYIGRPGWDASDDVRDDRSVDVIVEEYRKALKGAGIESPFIMMTHSMGGTYGSFWVSKYPEEVEAFINIDGTYVEPLTEEEMTVRSSGNILYKLAVNFGIGDILFPVIMANDANLSKEDWRTYCILQLLSISSDAVAQEGAVINKNRNAAWNALKETDVPKLYISSRDGDLSDPECKEANEKELIPYLEKMGNYEISYLPGSHFIYKTEPEECEKIIENFLKGLE
ncbi:MAG: alpha/beta hydrolase [Lachnospiraceae bacterium]|nr:alpha/beta hydrolase [Lachnospiraceae bacterium]